MALATLLPAFLTGTSQWDDAVNTICRRLKLSNHETERITWLVRHRDAIGDAPRMPLCALKRFLAQPGAQDLLTFAAADLRACVWSIDSAVTFWAEGPTE